MILTRDPNGQMTLDNIVKFDPGTGRRLNEGEQVNFQGLIYTGGKPLPQVQYNLPTQQTSQPQIADPYIRAVTNMLQKAQGGMSDLNKKYVENSGQLLEAQQRAENLGTDASVDMLNSDVYNPLNLVGMAQDAERAYNPSILSADKQLQQLANVYKAQGSNYETAMNTAQDILQRKFEEEQNALDRSSGGSAYTNYSAKQSEVQKQLVQRLNQKISKAEEGTRDNEGFITPAYYRNLKAEWVGNGFDGVDFDSIFSGYVNPKNAALYSTYFQTKISSNQDDDLVSLIEKAFPTSGTAPEKKKNLLQRIFNK